MEEITLEDVLFNKRQEPYTLGRFYMYMESMNAPELLDFWISVQDLRNMYEPNHPKSSYSMNNWLTQDEYDPEIHDFELRKASASNVHNRMSMKVDFSKYTAGQRMITACYLEEDAPLQVNLSDIMRNNILSRAPKKDSDKPVPGLFDEAQKECEKLLLTNGFLKFKIEADKSKVERKFEARPPPPRPISMHKNNLSREMPPPLPAEE